MMVTRPKETTGSACKEHHTNNTITNMYEIVMCHLENAGEQDHYITLTDEDV